MFAERSVNVQKTGFLFWERKMRFKRSVNVHLIFGVFYERKTFRKRS